MGATTGYESVVAGGDRFDAYCAVPEAGSGPGVLRFQEACDISDNRRDIAERPAVELLRHDAGHAFGNRDIPSTYHEPAAGEAWPRTLDVLIRHLR